MPSPFAIQLRRLILEKGMTITAFAKKVDASRNMVGFAIRSLRRPPLDRLEQWADALDLRGREREEFIWLGNIEHAPEMVKKRVAELERRLKLK